MEFKTMLVDVSRQKVFMKVMQPELLCSGLRRKHKTTQSAEVDLLELRQ